MKRNIIIAVLGFGAAVAAYGQGQVLFDNYTGTSSPKVTYNGVSLGSGWNAGLLYYVGTSAGDVPTSAAQMTAFNSGNAVVAFGLGQGGADGSAYAGWFSGGQITIPGVTAGTAGFVSFVVEAFNGSTYGSSSLAGMSPIFKAPVYNGSGALPDMGTTIASLFPANGTFFTVSAIPEPTTMALGGLGLAALMLFRRKQV